MFPGEWGEEGAWLFSEFFENSSMLVRDGLTSHEVAKWKFICEGCGMAFHVAEFPVILINILTMPRCQRVPTDLYCFFLLFSRCDFVTSWLFNWSFSSENHLEKDVRREAEIARPGGGYGWRPRFLPLLPQPATSQTAIFRLQTQIGQIKDKYIQPMLISWMNTVCIFNYTSIPSSMLDLRFTTVSQKPIHPRVGWMPFRWVALALTFSSLLTTCKADLEL